MEYTLVIIVVKAGLSNAADHNQAGPASINNINLLGWQPDGSDDGGQYYYDLALALVNPVMQT